MFPPLLIIIASVVGCSVVHAQVGDPTSIFTIQTSPPEPTSSSSSAGAVRSSSTVTSSSAQPTETASSQFPQVCGDECSVISNTLATCASGAELNITCLCTVEVEQHYTACIQCAIDLNPNPNSLASYQALIDAYVEQCASAPNNPIRLPDVTITLPSTASGSASQSPQSASGVANITSLASSSASSSASMSTSSVRASPSASTVASSAAAIASSSGAAGTTIGHIPLPGGLIAATLLGLIGGALLL